MKHYPLRKDVETVDVCECGHKDMVHTGFGFIFGKCFICTCPKYKKEKSMLKVDYLDRQNSREVKE